MREIKIEEYKAKMSATCNLASLEFELPLDVCKSIAVAAFGAAVPIVQAQFQHALGDIEEREEDAALQLHITAFYDTFAPLPAPLGVSEARLARACKHVFGKVYELVLDHTCEKLGIKPQRVRNPLQ